MPNVQGDNKIKATKVLEINVNHPVFETIKKYYAEDKEKLTTLSEVLYDQALLIEGVTLESPTKYRSARCLNKSAKTNQNAERIELTFYPFFYFIDSFLLTFLF